MEIFEALQLARIQFAFTIGVHIVFPALSIGLAAYLMVLEGLWLKTKSEVYINLYNYWLKPFTLIFGMGVVSGVVMSYQFGSNWGPFSDITGPILGPLLGYEVMTAFFLEAGFLGIMLFGRSRVSPLMHFFATGMVSLGTAFSAFWILSANSWMQTPAGYEINAVGQFIAADWWRVVFNPSFPYRLVHMLLAASLSTAFMIAATCAWQLLKKNATAEVRKAFSMAMWMIVIVAPLQVLVGDLHGLNTLEHQPAKIAAMEGHYESKTGAPLILFGFPDSDTAEVKAAVEIPHLGSLILTHKWNGEIKGLDAWPRKDWPNVPIVFFSFRIMLGLGMLMVAVGLLSVYLRWRGKLYLSRPFQKVSLLMGPSGLIAILAGWVTTEVGRQPYTVYGLLRTSDSVSPIGMPAVATSLLAFIIVYFIVFGAGIFYLLRTIKQAPQSHTTTIEPESTNVVRGSNYKVIN